MAFKVNDYFIDISVELENIFIKFVYKKKLILSFNKIKIKISLVKKKALRIS